MSFIDAHDFPAGLVLRVLGVAESTYYDRRARQVTPSRRELDDAALLEQILKIRAAHEFAATYGSPRVWLELRRQGVRVGRKRVERLMRTHGLQGAHLRRGWKQRLDPAEPAPHGGAGPGRTRLPRHRPEPAVGGRPDPDGHRRGRVVAGQRPGCVRQPDRRLGHRPARDHPAGAHRAQPRPALPRRAPGQLIFHSDKGAQYTALRFTQRLVDAGVAPSTGSTGDSFDNALAENLWSTIKVELLYWPGTTFATRAEAEHALLRYIDGWYNPRRIQAGLGGLSPDEYEDRYHRDATTPTDNPHSGKAGESHAVSRDLGGLDG